MIGRWNDEAVAASRMALGMVFIIAALRKWFDPAHQSTYYGNLAHASPMIGWAIVAGELLLGAWLLSGFRTGLAAGVALFVLAIFSGERNGDVASNDRWPDCG